MADSDEVLKKLESKSSELRRQLHDIYREEHKIEAELGAVDRQIVEFVEARRG